MKRIQMGMVAALLAFSAASCGPVKPMEKSDKNGDIYPPAKAIALLTGFPRWCYDDTDGDKVFYTHVFLQSGSGEIALYDANKRSYKSADAMTWTVNKDLLTMNLPQGKSWLRRMRFISENGRTSLILISPEDAGKYTLYPCNL